MAELASSLSRPADWRLRPLPSLISELVIQPSGLQRSDLEDRSLVWKRALGGEPCSRDSIAVAAVSIRSHH